MYGILQLSVHRGIILVDRQRYVKIAAGSKVKQSLIQYKRYRRQRRRGIALERGLSSVIEMRDLSLRI